MWILNQDRTKLKNTHNPEIGFSITRKDNAAIVSFMTHCVGRYYTDTEAKEALSKLAVALAYAYDGIRGDFSQGVMEIVWAEKTAKFCGRTKQDNFVEIAHRENVIGSVHDNPELLEVK